MLAGIVIVVGVSAVVIAIITSVKHKCKNWEKYYQGNNPKKA